MIVKLDDLFTRVTKKEVLECDYCDYCDCMTAVYGIGIVGLEIS